MAVVFVADTALPSARSAQVEHVLWDEQWKLVISDGGGGSKRGAPDPLQDLRRDLRRRKRNEERAVWYVALTRARDRLIVTHSRCEVDAEAHFADARAKLSQPYDPQDDDAVHFFHELWELVRADDQLAKPCGGGRVPAQAPRRPWWKRTQHAKLHRLTRYHHTCVGPGTGPLAGYHAPRQTSSSMTSSGTKPMIGRPIRASIWWI
jgi:ATP-dependent exoDNAse (exonuclease V) beta subunit